MFARPGRATLGLFVAAALALVSGCGGSEPTPGSSPGPRTASTSNGAGAASVARKTDAAPEMEAPPYTIDQLRDATRAGRTYVFAVETDGAPPKRRTMRFVGADGSGALVESETSNPDGSQAVSEPAQHVTWEEMRDHAAFPRAIVTRSEAHAKTRLGDFDCIVYTLRGDGGETTTFYFAKSMPGPPILFTTDKAGKVVKKSEVVEYRAGGAADVAAAGTAKIVTLKMAMKLDGAVDEKALVAALQSQLAPLDVCVKPLPRGDGGIGSLNARVTLTGQGPMTVHLESPVPPDVERCLGQVFAGWRVTTAGAGQSMILLELGGG